MFDFFSIYHWILNFGLQFEIVPETLKSSIANVSTDSDIEMIELSPERSKFRRSTRARSVSRSQQQQPQQQPTKKTRAKRTIPKQPDPVIKPTTNRSQRTAAKKAKQGITKSLEEESIYDFEDLDAIHPSSRTGSKRNNKPRSPSPISKFIGLGSKNKNTKTVVKARKLYSQKQNEMELNNNSSDVDGDDDDDTKKSPKTRRPIEIADVELTPTGFRKSIFKDPEVQKRHMLENASRINEDIKRISEPKRLTNSTKTNDLSGDIKVNGCACFYFYFYYSKYFDVDFHFGVCNKSISGDENTTRWYRAVHWRWKYG